MSISPDLLRQIREQSKKKKAAKPSQKSSDSSQGGEEKKAQDVTVQTIKDSQGRKVQTITLKGGRLSSL